MRRINNHKAFSLIETLMAVVFTVILVMVVVNFYNVTRVAYVTGVAEQTFQDGVNVMLSQIIQGKTEPSGVFRLSEAVSYSIPNLSELHFWGTDDVERWYRLNNTSTQLIYHHPTAAGTVDEVIYSAPAGATITLRFSVPAVANYTSSVVGVDVALSQNINGRTVIGSASTIIHLRNHP